MTSITFVRRLAGALTSFVHRAMQRRAVRIMALLILSTAAVSASLAGLAVLMAPTVDPAPYQNRTRSGELQDRNGLLLHAFLNSQDQWCFPRSLHQFSPHLVHAVIATEDHRFRHHFGVDVAAISRAVLKNTLGLGRMSGASTITMQVVKMTEGIDAGAVVSGQRHGWAYRMAQKIQQAWQAIRLEKTLSKDQILETYLNQAPYGLNLLGAEAAARRYFGKPAAELTLSEAALLAGLPQSPTSYKPLEFPDRVQRRRDHVLDRMFAEGYIQRSEWQEARNRPLGVSWHEFPRHAPHLAMHLRDRIQAKGGVLQTTLDESIQTSVEQLLQAHLKRFNNEVTNAAAMVMDVTTADILARVGSADFFETPGGGQVDLCTAPRAPGSTLKPFAYALAIEHNLLYPSEQLLDDTLDYGQYNPSNFDGEYHGLVSAETALRFSLNVPVVTTVERLGVETFLCFLQQNGLTTLLKSPQEYGLGLTLGNCEVRLDEMTAAYAMLAAQGSFRTPRQLADDPPPTAQPTLSRGAALALYQMLDAPFPQEPDQSLISTRGALPRVCWKTGTSTGYRDAWTFAFNRHYVVGVWLGNNNARASRRLVGARAALPLAAALFRGLPARSEAYWPETREDMREATMCAISGLPASEWCKQTTSAQIPSKMYLNRRCDVHAPTEDGGILERWPASAHGWDLAHIENAVTLQPDLGQDQNAQKQALKIKSPSNKAQFVLTGEPNGDRIPLKTSLDDYLDVHWYLDDQYLGASKPSSPRFLALSLGVHKVACMTPTGESDLVNFEVISPAGDRTLRTP